METYYSFWRRWGIEFGLGWEKPAKRNKWQRRDFYKGGRKFLTRKFR